MTDKANRSAAGGGGANTSGDSRGPAYNYNSYQHYYNVDSIRAEDWLIPCTTQFDFTYLSHLDPNLSPGDKENNGKTLGVQQASLSTDYLPDKSRIQLPLWALRPWSTAGYVRLHLPNRLYGPKTRDKLLASSASEGNAEPGGAASSIMDLAGRYNDRYYLTGKYLADLIEESFRNFDVAMKQQPGAAKSRMKQNQDYQAMEKLRSESRALRQVLLAVSVFWFLATEQSGSRQLEPHGVIAFSLCV
jgi:hypothetical protein